MPEKAEDARRLRSFGEEPWMETMFEVVIGVDPGPVSSAVVMRTALGVANRYLGPTDLAIEEMVKMGRLVGWDCLVAVEQIKSYGMSVTDDVHLTSLVSGRFVQRAYDARGKTWGVGLVPRQAVKLVLCGQARAKDANVRAGLIDLYSMGGVNAIGTKKKPGPLYGIKKDMWAALGVAVTAAGAVW